MNIHYTIHKVADLLGISADAIRLYEREGLVNPLRDETNGYRYYEADQIHRIMGISLYRKLGVSIPEIKKLLSSTTFSGISNGFSNLIEQNEQEIRRLENKIKKLEFMWQHLNTLNENLNTCTIRSLPAHYVLYHQDTAALKYKPLKDVFHSSSFSFGNFCYLLKPGANDSWHSKCLEFVVRKEMGALCLPSDPDSFLPKRTSVPCIYTVVGIPSILNIDWDLSALFSYAADQGLSCASDAHAFFVFSIVEDDVVMDYYEIFLPICAN